MCMNLVFVLELCLQLVITHWMVGSLKITKQNNLNYKIQ
jgi:hypothetical protein